jgi:8-oxo-dGTP pyrophosphatase MutT (NUDIX family)
MVRRREVVTCFLEHRGRILALKRSEKVRTHAGKWAAISGSVDLATPFEQALMEIREETGLGGNEVRLERQGLPLDISDDEYGVTWRVHPFLFSVADPGGIRLDWEHTESRWIDPTELGALDTVPRLRDTWERLSKK